MSLLNLFYGNSSEMRKLNKLNKELTEENSNLKEKINSLEISEKTLKKEDAEQKEKINNLGNQIKSLNNQIINKENIIENSKSKIKSLNEEIEKLKKENSKKKLNIEDLNTEISKFKNDINTAEYKCEQLKKKLESSELQNMNKELVKKNFELESNLNIIKKENEDNKFQINLLNKKYSDINLINKNQNDKIKIIEKEILMERDKYNKIYKEKEDIILEKDKFKRELFNYQDINKKTKAKLELLEKNSEDYMKSSEKIKDLNNELSNLKNDLIEKQKQITILEKIKDERRMDLKYDKEEFSAEKFYDIIIDINSLKGIKKGWEIKWGNENAKNYESLINNKSLRIGVLGNQNKGKSFILQKFSGKELPKGTNVKTKGLSLLYPKQNEIKNILLLDSAGFETPLLNEEEEANEINSLEKISEIAKDKINTELFLQKLIINFSDVLLIVLGQLTFSDQKLLNRITKHLLKNLNQNKREKIPKIFVIHNLQSFVEEYQVNDYIRDTLFRSTTFKIKETQRIQFTDKKTSEGKTTLFYNERINGLEIIHLLMANDYSPAGEIFNGNTINFLRDICSTISDRESMDIIEETKKSFVKFSEEVFEYNTTNQEGKEKIEIKSLSVEDLIFNENENKIKLNKEFNIKFKQLYVDELGISNFRHNGCNPKYCYYRAKENDQYYLFVKVELPGKYQNLKGICKTEQDYTVFRMYGEKMKDEMSEDISDLHDGREYGNFIITLPLNSSEIHYLKTKAIVSEKSENGIVTFKFLILDEENEE